MTKVSLKILVLTIPSKFVKKLQKQRQKRNKKSLNSKPKADTERAKADAAYTIQQEIQRKEIERETAEANIVKQEKEAEVKTREVEVRKQQLAADIKAQAEADRLERQAKIVRNSKRG
nr:hypothetical protein [Streptococcus cuniculi]